MASDPIADELNTFAQYPRAFTFAELSDFADSEVPCDHLLTTLVNDPRFIQLKEWSGSGGLFVPSRALFRWFSGLTMRLAEDEAVARGLDFLQAKQSRLNECRLASLMSCSLRLEGQWDVPPMPAVEFGQRFGFVAPAWTAGEYVFPLAHVLSFASPSLRKAARVGLESMREMENGQAPLLEMLEAAVEGGLSQLGERTAYIVAAREGLLGGKKLTLEQVGKSLGLTRERVRQLEAKFWTAMELPFLSALMRSIAARRGSLVFTPDSREGFLLRFIAKCVRVPHIAVPGTGLAILGASQVELPDHFPFSTEPDSIAKSLESGGRLCLVRDDLWALAEVLARSHESRLTRVQRVYLALRAIGRPAHYSTVAEVYNSMFPEQPLSEYNVHATLGRAQELGVVWIGIRGAFALKEWGYERPPKGIFDAVAEIVRKRYKETGKPVPFTVIAAEIGKYRQIVKPSSLMFAAHCNPALQRVGQDSFVPRDPLGEAEEEMSGVELDRILREFERDRGDCQ